MCGDEEGSRDPCLKHFFSIFEWKLLAGSSEHNDLYTILHCSCKEHMGTCSKRNIHSFAILMKVRSPREMSDSGDRLDPCVKDFKKNFRNLLKTRIDMGLEEMINEALRQHVCSHHISIIYNEIRTD